MLAGALGVLGATTPATKLRAMDGSMPSCCAGGMSQITATNAEAEAVAKATPDRLKTCPVSGEKLEGDMGKPLVFVCRGQQVKLCCKSCKQEFDKNPEKYLAKIRAADKK
jgi:YHS domain-containing protein